MIDNLFHTPIYVNKVRDCQALNYHIDKVIDKVDFNMKENWGATHYLSTDFSGSHFHIIKELGLHKLGKEIDNHLREYCDELKFPMREYKMVSWFSKFKKGNYAHIHGHGAVDISGVYYYKTNGKDGSIFFESPNPYLLTSKCLNTLPNRMSYLPEVGRILLFPGWLKHGVETNRTDDDRISLSFNISFKT